MGGALHLGEREEEMEERSLTASFKHVARQLRKLVLCFCGVWTAQLRSVRRLTLFTILDPPLTLPLKI